MRITESQLRRLIRENIQDEAAKSFAAKLFGTADSRTDLYDSVVESWLMNYKEADGGKSAGHFAFAFKPKGNELEVTVTAVDGADADSTSQLERETQSAVANLLPADWSGLSPAGYFYNVPGGVGPAVVVKQAEVKF